ncbi:MAG: AAA family ATPase [Deltaproteobacteria bacterium]|nr:AAA family ATPase [Deltaproteobacteria bacterium]
MSDLGPPRITRLRFDNFKGLQAVTVDVRSRFQLLIGRNACGKSSVLDGAFLVTRVFAPVEGKDDWVAADRASYLFTGSSDERRLTTKGAPPESLSLGFTSDGRAWWMQQSAPRTDGWRLSTASEIELQKPVANRTAKDTVTRINATSVRSIGGDESLGRVLRLRLSASRASETSTPSAQSAELEPDGHGLPTMLSILAANEPDARAAIEEDLRVVVPGAKRVRMPKAEVVRGVWGDSLEVEMDGAGWLPADLLSEGTLLTLALLAVLHAPDCPQLVLMDDIDKALHPSAQRELVTTIRKILERKPAVQVIATAHSPYLLDQFEGDQVCVLHRDKSGIARCRLLSEHPDFNTWRDKLGTGEFWSTVGEDWVGGG